MLTVLDGYCGAGGSSSGAEQVPGVTVRYALNHWDKAIATHNHNMPWVDHDRVDMTDDEDGDPRKYAATDLGWFSPECTTWSGARGEECDYDGKAKQGNLFDQGDDEPEPDEAKDRSRFQMETVPLFVAAHNYKAFIVENVTDILKWSDLDRWIGELRGFGYEHRIVVLNSAFAHHLGAPAPQLRDRVYFVFWKTTYRAPDFNKWCRPMAWCATCERVVRAMYVDKKPGVRRKMFYGQQYTYRCPSATCRAAVVQPYVLPAAAAIDWSIPAERIGDRKIPLKPKTVARIAAGLLRYAQPSAGSAKTVGCPPMLVPCGGGWNEAASSIGAPMRARTTREIEAVVVPPGLTPLLVPTTGRDGVNAHPVSVPARTQTGRHEAALVVPLRNNGVARPAAGYPAPTFAAAGTHHALVERDAQHAVYGYDTGHLRPLGLPLPTQTTVQGDALVGRGVGVANCTFRMLDVHEIKEGMAFASRFAMPFGAKRDKIRMLGNAVTPPAARDLIAAVVEAITGEPIDLTSGRVAA